jgi:hypothetical protein
MMKGKNIFPESRFFTKRGKFPKQERERERERERCTYFEMLHSFPKGRHPHILDLFVQFSPKSQT